MNHFLNGKAWYVYKFQYPQIVLADLSNLLTARHLNICYMGMTKQMTNFFD